MKGISCDSSPLRSSGVMIGVPSERVSLLESDGDLNTLYWRRSEQYGLNHARETRMSGVVA